MVDSLILIGIKDNLVDCSLLLVVCWWLIVGWGTGNGEQGTGKEKSLKLKVKS
jgi:hypothetical protein